MKTFVIAEAGSCHDGELLKALELVEAARDAGADAVKFQFWSDPGRLADRRRVPPHYRDIYRRYQLRGDWLPVLHDAAHALLDSTFGRRPIDFMATTYLPEDVATIAPFVKRFKIASFEANDEELMLAHRPFLDDRELIVSLGMNADDRLICDMWPVSQVMSVRLLHCVSSYPAPAGVMHLSLLHPPSVDSAGPHFDGLSDHTRNVLTGAVAVGAGARIIEAHLRLQHTHHGNPDFVTAFNPAEFAEYVRNIRFAEALMGNGDRQLQDCELEMAAYRVQPA